MKITLAQAAPILPYLLLWAGNVQTFPFAGEDFRRVAAQCADFGRFLAVDRNRLLPGDDSICPAISG